MKKVSFLKFRAKKRTFLKLETYPCTESGHQGAQKWPPWCPEIPNSWTRTHIPFLHGIFEKKVGDVHRFFWKFFWVFFKKSKKKIFWKKLEAYTDLKKNQKIVGDVHRFLWKKSALFLIFSHFFSKNSKKKYFEKSWKRTQITKKIRKLLETYTDFYENIFNFFELFFTFCTFFCKKNIL